ncbi:MAG TPA: DUF72 domain-containing protein [Actinomycetota bacterium]|nr:DUF72 domain-containing protein [Actinomycetota bacterium]
MRILVGTSGWQYDDWRGVLYPEGLPKRAWLGHLATRFPTVEVNSSFYRLPSAETFARWRAETPEGFVVAVKASRFVTHVRRLRDCREPVELLWSRARELGERLGPVLFQLPPRFAVDLDRLRGLLAVLPEGLRAAFEFRDPSWEVGPVFRLLDAAGAAFVQADRAGPETPNVVTGGWSYVRFHQGSPAAAGYPRAALERWADRIAGLDASEVLVYFNNDTGGAAVRDAITLTGLLAARTDGVPRTPRSRRRGGA